MNSEEVKTSRQEEEQEQVLWLADKEPTLCWPMCLLKAALAPDASSLTYIFTIRLQNRGNHSLGHIY
eukprot:1161645-Pelagomonas_calceolata.AAC.7